MYEVFMENHEGVARVHAKFDSLEAAEDYCDNAGWFYRDYSGNLFMLDINRH